MERQDETLAGQELVSSLSWLINLRWLAGLGVLFATWFCSTVLDLEIPTTPFRRVDGIEETTHLFQRGPVVRDEPAMVAAGGLPVAREEWDRMESLVDAFARPNTLAPVLRERLGTRLADPTADLERKQIAQDVGRLYEAGILEPADT